MRTVLLTGFEPFDQDPINPSWEAVKALDQTLIKEDVRIVSRQLPCVFSQAPTRLLELLVSFQPELVIAVGLGPGRTDISIERVAINLNHARGLRRPRSLLQHIAHQGNGAGAKSRRHTRVSVANGRNFCL